MRVAPQLWHHVVEQRSELHSLVLPCGFAYAVHPMGHAVPALCPERVRLFRVPLGPIPSLPTLRHGRGRLVRLVPRYYGRVRLLVIVHHRLRLIAFPMRTGAGASGRSQDLPAHLTQFLVKFRGHRTARFRSSAAVAGRWGGRFEAKGPVFRKLSLLFYF